MKEAVANLLRIPQDTAFQLEIEVQDKLREYVDNYKSPLKLSEKWVKRKGNDVFYRSTDYSYYLLGIRFLSMPAKWNEYEVDASDEFKYASYQYIPNKKATRAFLPNNQPSFDTVGNPTQDLFNFINELILSLLDVHFPEFISEEE